MHYANGVLPLCTITRRENGTGPYIPTLQLGIKRVLGNETRYFFLDLCEACLVFSVEDRGSDKLTNAMELHRHRSHAWCPLPYQRECRWLRTGERCSLGMVFLFTVRPTLSKKLLGILAGDIGGSQGRPDTRWLSVPPDTKRRPPSVMPSTHCSGSSPPHGSMYVLESRLQGLAESNGLC